MKTSGVFTLREYKVALDIDNVPLRLVFFGDVHRDSPLFAHDKWRSFLEYAKALPNARFLGMGDYIDSMSSSEREALARASFHDSTQVNLDNISTSNVAMLAKELDFMRGKLIGLVNGNHFYSYENGINSDQKLCERLGCSYLGVSSFIRLTIERNNTRHIFDIWVHHGAGGARLPGGSINRVDQMREYAEADCYAMGHDHKRGVFPASPRLSLVHTKNGIKLKERQSWLIRSGSFLKAYEDGQQSYNVDSARGPSSLGWVELEITHSREGLTVRGIA